MKQEVGVFAGRKSFGVFYSTKYIVLFLYPSLSFKSSCLPPLLQKNWVSFCRSAVCFAVDCFRQKAELRFRNIRTNAKANG